MCVCVCVCVCGHVCVWSLFLCTCIYRSILRLSIWCLDALFPASVSSGLSSLPPDSASICTELTSITYCTLSLSHPLKSRVLGLNDQQSIRLLPHLSLYPYHLHPLLYISPTQHTHTHTHYTLIDFDKEKNCMWSSAVYKRLTFGD